MSAEPPVSYFSGLKNTLLKALPLSTSHLFWKHSDPDSLEPPTQNAYRRTSALVLSAVSFILLVVSIAVNIVEGQKGLVVPLCAAAAVPISCVALLIRKRMGEQLILFLLTGTLFTLGLYLLFMQMAPHESSLYWFIIFPSMLMLSMGLRAGSIMFFIFFLVLLAVFITPLHTSFLPGISDAARVRFLLAMLGAFIFSWCAEYLRSNTYDALLLAMSRLEQQALTDPLTGLGNRRDFDKNFAWVMAKAARDNKTFSLALIDIDHFKSVNDTYGHDVGDAVLRHIAETLSAEMRATDRIFRWGGEEFVILMPDSGLDTARLVSHRIRRHVEKTPLLHGDEEILRTVSIGLYSGHADVSPGTPLFQADQNLYIAKNSGRNRVIG